MEDPRKLRELAGWYREFAERAGHPAIWHFRLMTAADLDRKADLLEKMAARSHATKPNEYIMEADSRSAGALRQVDLVINKPGVPKVASLSPRHKHRLVASAAAAMLAFAVGLLVAALAALAADEPARPRPTGERVGADSVRMQPTAEQFAPPNQPDVSASEASDIDKIYRQLIGPRPPLLDSPSSTRPRAAPGDDAAGSVRRWGNPR